MGRAISPLAFALPPFFSITVDTMNFPRQNKLDPILAALAKVPGVIQVQQDDWDSCSIYVHLTLAFDSPYKLTVRLQDTKRAIAKLGLRITDYPAKIREYCCKENVGPWHRSRSVYFDKGYDQQTITVEVPV